MNGDDNCKKDTFYFKVHQMACLPISFRQDILFISIITCVINFNYNKVEG